MATKSYGVRALAAAVTTGAGTAAESLASLATRRRRRAALIEQHRAHLTLLCKAMDDPALAAVLDTYEETIPPDQQRQFLYANALYTNALHFHRIGAMNRRELYGHLRVICRNPIVRAYLAATRHHRASLDGSSDEAELGRMVEQLLQDQEEAETDEWWVVGEPPCD
ncbi:hypothetical protein GTY65_25015 [Streptomyces sp. SID8379]|uniref:DUF6082 family protein n=1 Tax=unclassified Streptomyces TaxID=2593676 RepID=UPI000475BC23|nr:MULTISPECIES: DUF6082 family protein [unclassified Streptomyces]MYW67302.1 hypothetical protein [Streptomyces sp. SID8379]